MAEQIIRSDTLTALADAIRLKRDGSEEAFTPAAMARAVLGMPFGNIPSRSYLEAMRVAVKIKDIQDTGHRVLVFGCVTDTHPNYGEKYETLTRQSLRHGVWALDLVSRLVGADFAADLGDSAWENNDTGDSYDGWHHNQAYARRVMTGVFGDGKVIRIPGNHDQSLTPWAAYAYIGANNPFDAAGATPERGYGYIDLADKKVRVIALNTSDYNGVTGGYDLSYEQKKWFMEALDLSGKSDAAQWGIVILSHFPLDFADASSYNTVSEVQSVLQAYVQGGAVTISVNSSYASANGETVTGSLSYNYSGKNAAKLLLNAHGHLHNGAYGRMAGNEIPRVCAYNTCYELNKDDTYGEIYDVDQAYTKTNGTAEDTAVTFYAVDLDAQMIYAYVYGAGADRELYYGGGKQYAVTYALTNVRSSNASAIAVEGGAYTATLTPDADAQMKSVTVTMGGADITAAAYADGVVAIGEVTGDIVITAVAAIPEWSENVSDVAVAIRNVWHFNINDSTLPVLNNSNAYAAIGVTTANKYAYTDRENNTVYVMPVPEKASKVTVTNSDGSACTWRFWGLKENGDGTFSEMCDSGSYGEGIFSWARQSITHILIAAYHTDDSSWAWGYDDSQIQVIFSNF